MTQTITVTIDRQYKPWLITPNYAFKDDSRPVLNTIQLHPNGYMVAADGFCLMMAPIEIDEPGLTAPVLVPAKFMADVAKAWGRMPAYPLIVTIEDTGYTSIKSDVNGSSMSVQAGEGVFPDYWRIIPSEYGELARATFDPLKLTRLYEALVGDKKEPIAMAIYQGSDTGPGLVAPGDGGIGIIMPMSVQGGTSASRDHLTRRLDLFRLTPAERKAKQDAKDAAEDAEMIELLGETGTIKINELQTKHGAGYGSMTAVLARLREQGRIVREGDRSWEQTVRLADAGTWVADHPEIAAANEQAIADLDAMPGGAQGANIEDPEGMDEPYPSEQAVEETAEEILDDATYGVCDACDSGNAREEQDSVCAYCGRELSALPPEAEDDEEVLSLSITEE